MSEAQWEPYERALRRFLRDARVERDRLQRELDRLRDESFVVAKPRSYLWLEKRQWIRRWRTRRRLRRLSRALDYREAEVRSRINVMRRAKIRDVRRLEDGQSKWKSF